VISHVGKYLKGDSLQFVTLQLLMAQRHPKGRRYTDADKLQALALYNSGPKAYKHLANIFLLPSKVSLSNWLRNMKCSPGFHKESFNGLSERLKYMSNRDKNCTLLIDEISIKSNLQYDRHNDIIIGYEDYGHYCPRSCTKAKSALVFMLRGIASNWSQPLGFVFTASACKADIIKCMLLDCLDKCVTAGAIVKAIISDQGPNFQQLVNRLGVSVEAPFFMHNEQKYFYIFDPPHLLKSTRNNLFKYPFHFSEKKVAKWDVIKEFYIEDKKQSFRQCPKLEDKHIYLPIFSKMKVKLAAQIFSHSLAVGLDTHCRLSNKKIDKTAYKDTAEFVENFNNIFDLVNSNDTNLCKITETARESVLLTKINNYLEFIKSIKVMAGKKCVNTRIKCLKGWQISLNSILQLWPLIHEEQQFKYLCTRRLNSDPIENLFSIIRFKCGNCKNPTSYNFARVLKQITCEKLFKPVKNGNCEMDVTRILTAVCQSNESTVKRFKTSNGSINSNSKIPTVLPHFFIPAIPNADLNNKLEDNALHYVCGYLLKKIRQWHSCTYCDNILRAGEGYLKFNEIFTKLKTYNDNCSLENVSQAFHFYVINLEQKLVTIFDKCSHKTNVASLIVNELKLVKVPTACIGFPKFKFLHLFTRLRIYYLIKFSNRENNDAVSTYSKKKYKEFKHK
jgi:hypothetical protein